jgi:hypothetical protein
LTKLAVINESKRVTTSDVGLMVAAVRRQVTQAARLIDRYVPSIRTARGAPVGSVPLLIVDNPDVANALGYHDVDPRGVPYGRVFVDPVLDNGGSALGDAGDPSLSVSAVLSHEVLEWWYDPACNDWSDRGRSSVAKELCDPVENDYYLIDGVAVSNFVLPAWFNPLDKRGPWDRLGRLFGPFTMTHGGYWIEMADGGVRQVFADDNGRVRSRRNITPNPARGARTALRMKTEPDTKAA